MPKKLQKVVEILVVALTVAMLAMLRCNVAAGLSE
jgi:hypothetical protein